MSHTVTITKLPEETSDDADYTVDGTCTTGCKVWGECMRPWCVILEPEYADEDEFERHGHYHSRIDGAHMIESDECALHYAHNTALEVEAWGKLGTFAFEVRWNGDDWDSFISELEVVSS